VTLSCPCGRIQQPAPCLRSTSNTNTSNTPVGSNGGNGTGTPTPTPTFSTFSREIKCTPECGIAARNARLADALGISKEVRERGAVGKEVEWSPELRAFAKTNPKFVEMVEKAFAE
jgi:transcriptional repressor NF-X1